MDRVWTVTPGVFAKPITYVLECKWGVIHKRDVDEFFEVLRWSKEFGADTEEGRTVKQGIIGVFAGGVFDPQEKVYLKDEAISLASYAGRLNVQLLKAADFNEKLHERGVLQSITVQAVCRRARDEAEVKETLNKLWENPEKANEILSNLAQKNMALYDFEKMLKETGKT